jgi:alginate O-acetyltransferase complex protein AlgI
VRRQALSENGKITMQFHSLTFFIFLAFFFAVWPFVRRRTQLRYAWLVITSFVFYGWWDWRFLFLLVGTGLIDFIAALAIERWPRYRKPFLIVSLAGNLGSLALFKYVDFGIDGFNHLLTWMGISASIPAAGLILPVGISFYTFQSMSYTIDVYRGQLQSTRNVMHFFAYLALFPQLVAGPIVRASDLLGQLTEYHPTTEEQRWTGLQLIVLGFFKKVVIADNLAPIVNSAFSPGSQVLPSTIFWWIVMAMFAFQIYCDFSGYSDIARGLARWMGYEFNLNFDHPYIAQGFADFWRHWHISLSTWFRDYLYIPLGGSRKGGLITYRNLWITFLLSGLWHGAASTFLIWGALHALYLSLEKLTDWPRKIKAIPGGSCLAVLITFILTLVAWVFFRAASFSQAVEILSAMFIPQSVDFDVFKSVLTYKTVVLMAVMVARQIYVFRPLPSFDSLSLGPLRWAQPVGLALILVVCLCLRGPGSTFIYFQF